MKRSIMILVAVLVVLYLAACGKNETEKSGEGNGTQSDNAANVTLKVPSATATPAVKVNTPDEDKVTMAKIVAEAEKVAADVQWDLYPGTEFWCNINDGSITLEIRAFGKDTVSAVSAWYAKSGVKETENNKALSSEKSVGWKGAYEGMLTDDGTVYWKAIDVDPAADALLFPEDAKRFAGEFVTIWHTAKDLDYRTESFAKAVADFNNSHSDIMLVPRAFDDNAALNMALYDVEEADMLPDIFERLNGRTLQSVVEYRWAHNLDEVYDRYKNELPEGICEGLRINDKLYTIPYVGDYLVLYANKKLLREAGYTEVPMTFEEFEVCCKKLLDAGVTPFNLEKNGNYVWKTQDFFETFLQKAIGPEKMKNIFSGRSDWSDPELANAVELFRSMIDKGYVKLVDPAGEDENGVLGDYPLEAFGNGESAFIVAGSWYAANLQEMNNAFGEEIVAVPFPVINPEYATIDSYVAYLNYGFCVAEKPGRADATAETAFEFVKTVVRHFYADSVFYPTWPGEIKNTYVGELQRDVAAKLLNVSRLNLNGSLEIDPMLQGSYFDALFRLIDEGMSGTDFIKTVLQQKN